MSGVKFDPILGELRQDDSGTASNGVPVGGTTDQVLAKNSNTDNDLKWKTVTSGSGDMLKATYDPGNVNGQLVGTGDSRLSDSRPASDVSAWAKAGTKPSYTYTEVEAEQSGAVAIHSGLSTGVHGSGANNFIYSNDSRLTNSRTPVPAGSDKYVQFNDGGTTQNGTADLTFDKTNKILNIGQATSLSANPLALSGTVAGWVQANIQNKSNDVAASSDWIATADTGTDSTNYVDLGINSSTYNQAAYNLAGALDAYLYNMGANLAIGTGTAGQVIKFNTGGTTTSNLRATINDYSVTSSGFVAQPVNTSVAVNTSLADTFAYLAYDLLTITGTSILTIPGTAIVKVI